MFALVLDIPSAVDEVRILRVATLVGLLALSSTIYFAAVRLVLRHTWPGGTPWAVLGVAIALHALLLIPSPILSTDIYRYVWDGRVQTADINPYRYIPADPALASLRDPVVYPQINRADHARTIYTPLAEAVFAAVVLGDRFLWPSLVYVPAILLLADPRPWRAIKLRRSAENGETPCPLRLP